MAFNPEQERREGQRGMLGMFGGSPLSGGGMLSAGGTFVPQLNPFQRPGGRPPGMTIGPSMPTVDYGSGPVIARPGVMPQKTPEQLYEERVWINDTQWHSPGRPDMIFGPPSDPNLPDFTRGAEQLDPGYSASPRPAFVPADWVYIGNGDWGPPGVYGPGGTEGPPLAGPPMPTAENPLIPGSTYSGPVGALPAGLPPGLLGPVTS